MDVMLRLEKESSLREEEEERIRELLNTTRREYADLETTLREIRATEMSTSVSISQELRVGFS